MVARQRRMKKILIFIPIWIFMALIITMIAIRNADVDFFDFFIGINIILAIGFILNLLFKEIKEPTNLTKEQLKIKKYLEDSIKHD